MTNLIQLDFQNGVGEFWKQYDIKFLGLNINQETFTFRKQRCWDLISQFLGTISCSERLMDVICDKHQIQLAQLEAT